MGRPSLFTQEIADAICERLSNGEPLAAICRDEKMPGLSTVYDWQKADAEFSGSIARAREAGFDQIAIDALEIADDGTNDFVEKKRQDGSTYDAVDAEHIARSKLRVDTRLKLLAKWDPKRYGDRQLLGSDPDNPLPAGFQVQFVKGDEAS
jgi:hypothetical protein